MQLFVLSPDRLHNRSKMSNNIYFLTPQYNIAVNLKVGTSSIGRAVINRFFPHIEAEIAKIKLQPRQTVDSIRVKSLCPTTENPQHRIVLLVRDPIERFRSSMAHARGLTVDRVLDDLEAGIMVDPHFEKQSKFNVGQVQSFKFPDDLELFAKTVGLQYPLPVVGRSVDKPMLSDDQIYRVSEFYKEDFSLFSSI